MVVRHFTLTADWLRRIQVTVTHAILQALLPGPSMLVLFGPGKARMPIHGLCYCSCGKSTNMSIPSFLNFFAKTNRARRQRGFPTFISRQRQDANMLPKRRQSHQGDKLCDVSMVPLVARWPVFLACGSDADGEPHCTPQQTRLPDN